MMKQSESSDLSKDISLITRLTIVSLRDKYLEERESETM